MSVLFCLKQNDRKVLPLKWLRIDQTTSLSFEHVYRKSRADKIANRGESQGDRFPVLFSQKKSFSFETVFISVYRRSKADDRQKTCQKVLNSFSSKTSLVWMRSRLLKSYIFSTINQTAQYAKNKWITLPRKQRSYIWLYLQIQKILYKYENHLLYFLRA